MRHLLLATAVIATLPFSAGFAFAQGMPPMGGSNVMGSPNAQNYERTVQLEAQIRDLTNQLEQQGNDLRLLRTDYDRMVTDVNDRLQALESRGGGAAPMAGSTGTSATGSTGAPMAGTPQASQSPSVPQPTPGGMAGGTGAVSGSLPDPNAAYVPSGTAGQLGEINETPAQAAAQKNAASSAAGGTSAASLYDESFSYMQRGDYAAAEQGFTSFLSQYSKHPLAANARYWIGETWYARNDFTKASQNFAKSFQEYPNGQKAPDSLLKLAQSLDKTGKSKDACLTLGELKKRFPSGPSAVLRQADAELQRMKCAN